MDKKYRFAQISIRKSKTKEMCFMDEKAMFKLSYGLFLLTARENKKDNGCIINTALQVTAAPNQIGMCVNKRNLTHDMIFRTKKFNLSVLSEAAEFSLFERFGFHSGRDTDKFADFRACRRAENGILYLTEGTNAYLSIAVSKLVDLDTHTMFIGPVTGMEVLSGARSATYDYYFAHIKPKLQETAAQGKTVWRCKICGYEYEGEQLPKDFICPICKHPAADFERVK